ncbi:hypothetical protein LCGC14_0771390 [marine sediment metagenome]|uniref:Uncharacterized protein n=2 Tax=root TaxID=1 RepID=A0A831QKA7_9FLAO|nr:hypothetical protein [Pricia antarctica]
MKIINDETYDLAAAEWQYQMILILKCTLEKHGVEKSKLKDICGDFAFDLAMLQDQGEIQLDGKELRPVICFEDSEGSLKYNSTNQSQIHDYAFGNVSEAFGK